MLTHESFRHSYFVFSLISLAFIAFMVLTVRFSFFTLTHRGHYSSGLAIIVCLNYLVNVLPASIIAWKEGEVLID